MQKDVLGGCYVKHRLYMYRLAYTRLHNKTLQSLPPEGGATRRWRKE